jgi:SAM-dependent methyltransferase
LGDEFIGLCEEAGLLRRSAEGLRGTVTIVPDDPVYLIADLTLANYGFDRMYWVMGSSSTTKRVANSVPQREHGRVLDLCCGGGVQAFLLSPYADGIVAADRNPRALNYARFAAGINRLSNIEFRETDGYSAVQGETFDLIVCNPPFVINPGRASYYRDGGIEGDGFSEMIVRRGPAFLREGGYMHLICDIATFGETTASQRLESWVKDSGCDVMAFSSEPVGVVGYTTNWLEPYKALDAKKFQVDRDDWIRYLEQSGITSIVNLLVTLRKRASGSPNWVYIDTAPATQTGNFGGQLRRMFAGQDLLQQSDEAIQNSYLMIAPEIRMHGVYRPENGKWAALSPHIKFSEGMQFEFRIDALMAGYLARCTGEQRCGDLLTSMADAMNRPAAEVLPSALKYVRGLIASGVLAPKECFEALPRQAASPAG